MDAGSKEKSHNVAFAKGGPADDGGLKRQGAVPQTAAGTAHPAGSGSETEDGNGPPVGEKFAKGGSTKMFGFTGSLPARAGITSAR